MILLYHLTSPISTKPTCIPLYRSTKKSFALYYFENKIYPLYLLGSIKDVFVFTIKKNYINLVVIVIFKKKSFRKIFWVYFHNKKYIVRYYFDGFCMFNFTNFRKFSNLIFKFFVWARTFCPSRIQFRISVTLNFTFIFLN